MPTWILLVLYLSPALLICAALARAYRRSTPARTVQLRVSYEGARRIERAVARMRARPPEITYNVWQHPEYGIVPIRDDASEEAVLQGLRLAGAQVEDLHDDHAHNLRGGDWEASEGGLTLADVAERMKAARAEIDDPSWQPPGVARETTADVREVRKRAKRQQRKARKARQPKTKQQRGKVVAKRQARRKLNSDA